MSKSCIGLVGDLAVAFVHHAAEVRILSIDTVNVVYYIGGTLFPEKFRKRINFTGSKCGQHT